MKIANTTTFWTQTDDERNPTRTGNLQLIGEVRVPPLLGYMGRVLFPAASERAWRVRCLSRKRLVKLVMDKGRDRTCANHPANQIRRWSMSCAQGRERAYANHLANKIRRWCMSREQRRERAYANHPANQIRRWSMSCAQGRERAYANRPANQKGWELVRLITGPGRQSYGA